MLVFYIVLAIIVLFSFQKKKPDSPLCDKDDTDAIKGVCIFLVFMSHVQGYIPVSDAWMNKAGRLVSGGIGQLMVVPFLFFSGYGVAESFAKRGGEYIRNFPKNRMLMTLVNFDVAVLVFAIVAMILPNCQVGVVKLLLSLLAWDNVGNSNWYIFSILVCYIVWFSAVKVSKRPCAMVFVSVFAITQLMSLIKPSYWYNTMMGFPFGVAFSLNKRELSGLLRHKWISVSIFALVGMAILYPFRGHDIRGIVYNSLSVFFCVGLIAFMCRFCIDSCLFRWAGRNLFAIYIYQRLPMMICFSCGMSETNEFLFVVVCLVTTFLIAVVHDKFKVDRILHKLK